MMKDRLSSKKHAWGQDNLAEQVKAHLDKLQDELYVAAKDRLDGNTVRVDSYDDLKGALDDHKFVMAHWDGTAETEAKLKTDTKATIRCLPLEGDDEAGECVITGPAVTAAGAGCAGLLSVLL